MSDALYRWRPVSRRSWAVPVVLWVISTLALMLWASPRPIDTFDVVVSIVAPAMIFGVWLLTLYSVDRYAAVTVTRTDLVVGRDRVAVAHLDAAWLADPQAAVTTPADGFVGGLLGGGWATVIGQGIVSLRLGDGGRVSVQTRDQQGLVAALRRAVGLTEERNA